MCGIAGFNLVAADAHIDSKALTIDLLHQIESRGTDAAGVAWWHEDVLWVQKDGMRARWFTEFLDMPSNATNVIMHTRLGTQGSETNNDNNHPVVTGNIVGVHNGCIYNDGSLFRRMGLEEYRIAEVDTEAAFASIAYGNLRKPDGTHRLAADLKGVLESIEGSAALAWFEMEGDPNAMHLTRVSSSPIVYGITPNGSLIFASEKSHLESATAANKIELDFIGSFKEGEYVKFVAGELVEHWTYDSGYTYTSSYTYRSYSGSTHTSKSTTTTTTASSSSSSTDLTIPSQQLQLPETTGETGGITLNKKRFDRAAQNLQSSRVRDGWTPYLNHTTIHDHLLWYFDLNNDPTLDDEKLATYYANRQKAIDGWAETLAGNQFEHADEWLAEMGAYIRPGMTVKTDIPGYTGVMGTIIAAPQTFPTGSYFVRVIVENSRYPDGYETLIVERHAGEFELVTQP